MVNGNKKVISISEAREFLEKMDFEESDQIQKRTLEYSIKYSKTTPEKSRKAQEDLIKECGFTESESVELINILPESHAELRVFTSGWKKLISTETLDKTLKILSKAKS